MTWLIAAGFNDAFSDPSVGGPPVSVGASLLFLIVVALVVLLVLRLGWK